MTSLMTLVCSVRRGARVVVPSTAMQVPDDASFHDLWDRVVLQPKAVNELSCLPADHVDKVRLHSMGRTSESIVIDSMSMGITVASELGLKGVEFILRNDVPSRLAASSNQATEDVVVHVPSCTATDDNNCSCNRLPNAFNIMKKAAATFQLPKKIQEERKLTGPENMFNDLLDWAENKGAGWSRGMLDTGKVVITSLRNALWYIDHAHEAMASQACHVPICFNAFQGYNDYKSLKHKVPIVKCSRLAEICNDLAKALSFPSMSITRNLPLTESVSALLSSMTKYRDHKAGDIARSKANHMRTARKAASEGLAEDDVNDHDEANDHKYIPAHTQVPEQYIELDCHLIEVGTYNHVNLEEFCPPDRVDRRKYINKLQLSMATRLYRVQYGGCIGTLNFLWAVPPDHSIVRAAKCAEIENGILGSLPKYSSRQMRREFIHKYQAHVKAPKSVLRYMYSELTGCENAAESSSQQKVNERTAEILAGCDEPELMFDMRATNGKDDGTKFQRFYDEVDLYFNDQLAVHERRHGEELYLPLAISMEDLRSEVTKRLPEGVAIPSCETLRLQFHPANPFARTAERYTGRFNVCYRVQTRMSRVGHPDARYVATQYNFLKEFAIKYRESSLMVCLDDKATIPVGEPGVALSTGVRGHNRVLAPADGPQLVACDHDFHKSGLVPSVAFLVDIPEHSADSFFQGTIHVTTKDKVFHPSTPFRHVSELVQIIKQALAGSEVKPILIVFTDGGPDHRLTYETVKVSLMELWMLLDLDMLVAMRTAPNNSWVNPAERCMSILNLALQHVALQRDSMEDKYEKPMSSKSSMNAIRNYADIKDGFADAYSSSMKPVIDLVSGRFCRMKLKDRPVEVHPALDDDVIAADLSTVRENIPGAARLDIHCKTAQLKKIESLQSFMNGHSKANHYMYQIIKCSAKECTYCTTHPSRLPVEVLESLHYLPDPVPDPATDNSKYQSFSQLYGEDTTDCHRPSLQKTTSHLPADCIEADRVQRDVLKAAKVRSCIKCMDCDRPRVVCSPKKLDINQERILNQLADGTPDYLCGDPFPVEDSGMVMQQSIDCSSPVQMLYFSATATAFEPVCYYCGSQENLLDDFNEYMAEQLSLFARVRPLCETCREAGKEAKTWGKNFLQGKKQKK